MNEQKNSNIPKPSLWAVEKRPLAPIFSVVKGFKKICNSFFSACFQYGLRFIYTLFIRVFIALNNSIILTEL